MRKVITAKTSCSEEMLEICDRISKLNIDCLIESRENLLRIKFIIALCLKNKNDKRSYS